MAYNPSELFTLPDQLRLLAETMPEGEAKERLRKAFVHREIVYRPLTVLPHDTAKFNWTTGEVSLTTPIRRTLIPTLTAAEFIAHFPQAASALARRTSETIELLGNPTPTADPPLSEAPTSGKAALPTAAYLNVKDAVQKRGSDTEAELLRAVKAALPGKRVPRAWVRRARDELFGKPGRKGRPKSPK